MFWVSKHLMQTCRACSLRFCRMVLKYQFPWPGASAANHLQDTENGEKNITPVESYFKHFGSVNRMFQVSHQNQELFPNTLPHLRQWCFRRSCITPKRAWQFMQTSVWMLQKGTRWDKYAGIQRSKPSIRFNGLLSYPTAKGWYCQGTSVAESFTHSVQVELSDVLRGISWKLPPSAGCEQNTPDLASSTSSGLTPRSQKTVTNDIYIFIFIYLYLYL